MTLPRWGRWSTSSEFFQFNARQTYQHTATDKDFYFFPGHRGEKEEPFCGDLFKKGQTQVPLPVAYATQQVGDQFPRTLND